MAKNIGKACVDPGDLYTILRIFYAAAAGGWPYSQAERGCAERLNDALREVQWEVREHG